MRRPVEQLQRLRGGEPLAGLAGCRSDEVTQQLVRWQLGVLLGQRPEGRQVGVGLVGQQCELVEGFGPPAGLQQCLFGKVRDGLQAGGASRAFSHVGDGVVDLTALGQHAGAPHQVLPDRSRVHGQQFQQFVVATGLEQGAVAQGGAGEEGIGAVLAFAQHAALGRQQLVGPGRGQLGRCAQLAPVVAQVFDVGWVVFLDGLEEAVEPLLARDSVDRGVADDRYQFLHGCIGSIAQCARGTVDLVEGGREPFQEQDSALSCRGRVVPGDGADFGEGLVDALDRELGAFPAICSAAEARAEVPGVHERCRRQRRTAPSCQASFCWTSAK